MKWYFWAIATISVSFWENLMSWSPGTQILMSLCLFSSLLKFFLRDGKKSTSSHLKFWNFFNFRFTRIMHILKYLIQIWPDLPTFCDFWQISIWVAFLNLKLPVLDKTLRALLYAKRCRKKRSFFCNKKH